MLEDILNNKEQTGSILIIDKFNDEASALLISVVKSILKRDKTHIKIYPTFLRNSRLFKQYFQSTRIEFDNLFLDNLFVNGKSFNENCFESIINEYNSSNDDKCNSKLYFVCDNLNLLCRNFDKNPFRLIHFINSSINKKSKLNTMIMLAHQDSIEETLLNQIKSVFQTIILVKEKNLKNNQIKFEIRIDHKNKRTSKVTHFNETVFLNDNLEIENIEKKIISNNKNLNKDDENEDVTKGLTFNLNISSNDLEAKKNLVLPYEITGFQNKSQVKIHDQNKQEESKIYYAPDKQDDFDDEDPDEDLNF